MCTVYLYFCIYVLCICECVYIYIYTWHIPRKSPVPTKCYLGFSTAHLFLTITRCFGGLSETIFRKRCLYTQNTAWEVNDWTARQLPSVSKPALGCFTVFISPLVTVQCVRCWEEADLPGVRSVFLCVFFFKVWALAFSLLQWKWRYVFLSYSEEERVVKS